MEPRPFSLDHVGQRSIFSCPECNGALWEVAESKDPHFRCHVGHAYSPKVLAAEQMLAVEQSLWSGVRALKESAALDTRLAQRSAELGMERAVKTHQQDAAVKTRQVDQLLKFLHSFQPATLGTGTQ